MCYVYCKAIRNLCKIYCSVEFVLSSRNNLISILCPCGSRCFIALPFFIRLFRKEESLDQSDGTFRTSLTNQILMLRYNLSRHTLTILTLKRLEFLFLNYSKSFCLKLWDEMLTLYIDSFRSVFNIFYRSIPAKCNIDLLYTSLSDHFLLSSYKCFDCCNCWPSLCLTFLDDMFVCYTEYFGYDDLATVSLRK